MRINECFNLAQDNLTEYFKKFNGDNLTVKERDNAVWVVSKIRIHIFKQPVWLETITAESYTSSIKPIRVEMETKFYDSNNDLVFIANQQSCPLDIDSRKLRKIDTLTFPSDLEVDESSFEDSYQMLNDSFNENDLTYEQTVYSQDIDFSNHVNNAVYVRYFMNSIPSEFLDKITITDVEVHYIAECREGQKLRIYKKEIDNNTIRFLIMENDREVIRASLKYTKN